MKVAVSVIGPLIVIEAGLFVPERADSAPTPIREAVAASWRSRNRNSCSAVSPSTAGTHGAAGSVVIEIRRVSLVSGGNALCKSH